MISSPFWPGRAGLAILALAATLLSGCAREEPEIRYRFPAMGTLVEVTIYDFPAEAADEAARDVEDLFLKLQREWDPWEGGALAALNAALAEGGEIRPDDELSGLLARASRISAASGGAFDPAIGRLVKLWGFQDAEHLPEAPPPAGEIEQLLDSTEPLPRIWDEQNGVLTAPANTVIDLGAFAKGVAVDRAIELLRSLGVRHAIVNAGGDLRAIGRHGDRAWKIGVREPRNSGILAAIEIAGDESVFTSGDYERFFDYQGHRYHHILDPRTGYPTQDLVSVTIIGANAGDTDAACTALMVAGHGHWPAVAAALGITQVMVVDREGVIEMTPPMQKRVKILREEPPTIKIREVP